MRRAAILSIVIFFGFAGTLWSVNPDDLKFERRLTSDVHAFHAGESIPLEMAFSSASDKKYYGSFSNPTPEMAGQEPEVTPSEGFVNLKNLREGFAGSILSSDGYLTPTPHTLQLDLSGWFRFTKSGHYSGLSLDLALCEYACFHFAELNHHLSWDRKRFDNS